VGRGQRFGLVFPGAGSRRRRRDGAPAPLHSHSLTALASGRSPGLRLPPARHAMPCHATGIAPVSSCPPTHAVAVSRSAESRDSQSDPIAIALRSSSPQSSRASSFFSQGQPVRHSGAGSVLRRQALLLMDDDDAAWRHPELASMLPHARTYHHRSTCLRTHLSLKRPSHT
jgi:hypothetical protein